MWHYAFVKIHRTAQHKSKPLYKLWTFQLIIMYHYWFLTYTKYTTLMKGVNDRGARVAQSVNHSTFGFGSGHDLKVRVFEPCVWLCTDSVVPAWDSFSPSLSAPPLLALCVSLTTNKQFLKKIIMVGETLCRGTCGGIWNSVLPVQFSVNQNFSKNCSLLGNNPLLQINQVRTIFVFIQDRKVFGHRLFDTQTILKQKISQLFFCLFFFNMDQKLFQAS